MSYMVILVYDYVGPWTEPVKALWWTPGNQGTNLLWKRHVMISRLHAIKHMPWNLHRCLCPCLLCYILVDSYDLFNHFYSCLLHWSRSNLAKVATMGDPDRYGLNLRHINHLYNLKSLTNSTRKQAYNPCDEPHSHVLMNSVELFTYSFLQFFVITNGFPPTVFMV